ncbi:MAG: hypothetical protein IKZ86_09510 [Spirochaetaceae bacterium]|nr:hypothetical protein [Spirochaetaceae bacterium]
MTSDIVTAIISSSVGFISIISGAAVSIYSIKSSAITKRQQKIAKEILDALSNFHELEEEYIKKLIDARTKNGEKTFVTHDAIVKEMRKALRERNIDFDCSPSDITWYKKNMDLTDN